MAAALTLFIEQVANTSLTEWLAVLLAIAYVLLAARQNVWCWPAAFTSTALYTWLFWQVALPFQSVLNVFYMAMAIYGYWQWHHHAAVDKRVVSWPVGRHVIVISVLTILTLCLYQLVYDRLDGEYVWLDAGINVFSVATTFMVAHKILQNWLYWLVINSAAVFLYAQSGLILSACLFAGYVLFSVYGYQQWKKEQSAPTLTNN